MRVHINTGLLGSEGQCDSVPLTVKCSAPRRHLRTTHSEMKDHNVILCFRNGLRLIQRSFPFERFERAHSHTQAL